MTQTHKQAQPAQCPWTWDPHRALDGAYPVFGKVVGLDGYAMWPRVASVKASGGPIAPNDPDGSYGARDEANARRIVAAVNACEGIPTEALEAGIVTDLRAACEAALRYDASILGRAASGNVDLLRTGLGVAEGEELDALYEDWMSKAHAAIAKAKGVSP